MKSKRKGKRPSAGAKSSNVVISPFRVSIFERFYVSMFLIFGVFIPRVLNMLFHDFNSLKSIIVKSVQAFKKSGSMLHHLLVYLRARITVKNADVMNLEKAFIIAYIVKKFRKAGIKVTTSQYLILASLPSVTQVIIAVMNEPVPYREKGNFALGIINACSDNPLIIVLPLLITTYRTHLADFNTAQANMATGAHAATEIRNKAWIVVKHDLLNLMSVAQLASDEDTLNGIEIIQSGNFKVKMVGKHEAHIFKAITGGPGIMNISAGGAPRGFLHDWYISLDGVTWTMYLSTDVAKMIANGLVPQTKVWFRHRTRKGTFFGEFEVIYVSVV